ncbi:tumor necrosis factor ligand superfamily member 14-like [Littorina saxatilis]|uniref:THD domain-containing protein n=1 Tax=Littorina saxatilis TaxID=31220 RepID=A0AAN9ANI0_9CAEN
MKKWNRFKSDFARKSAWFKPSVLVVLANPVILLVLVMCLFIVSPVLDTRRNSESYRRTVGSASEMTRGDKNRYCFKEDRQSCLEKGYRVKLLENRTLCCGELGEHLYGLMSEELRERLETDASKGRNLDRIKGYIHQLHVDPSAVQARPAAHVGILQNGNTTGPDSGAPRIHWEKSGEGSFVSGGLIHGGDRLTVTKAGYYYVYTGLQFNVDPKTVESGALVAYIYRHVNGTRESRRKLMMARESSCKNTRGNIAGPVSVYMAGIFLLRDKDEISIRTHSQSLLRRSPATTYMGMHMV